MKTLATLSLIGLVTLFSQVVEGQALEPGEQQSKVFKNNAATPAQLVAHPWLQDRGLTVQLDKYSPEMAQLVGSEQAMLKWSFDPTFRRGTGQLKPDNDATSYKWELINRPDVDEYRLIRDADRGEVRLILSAKKWLLFAGDYTKLLGEGNILVQAQSR